MKCKYHRSSNPGTPQLKRCDFVRNGKKPADSTIERCVDFDRGEAARTHYRSIFYDPVTNCSLVSLKLETGRTHQIRVHLKYLGHPLPGDFLYCPDFSLIRRQALHSHKLTFLHPLSGEEMCFLAPLPADMKAMLPSMIP